MVSAAAGFTRTCDYFGFCLKTVPPDRSTHDACTRFNKETVMSRPFSTENVFRALGHRTRRQILESLRKGERQASELMEGADFQLSTLSEHLRILRALGLVTYRRRGTKLIYELNSAPLLEAATWLASMDKRVAIKK